MVTLCQGLKGWQLCRVIFASTTRTQCICIGNRMVGLVQIKMYSLLSTVFSVPVLLQEESTVHLYMLHMFYTHLKTTKDHLDGWQRMLLHPSP